MTAIANNDSMQSARRQRSRRLLFFVYLCVILVAIALIDGGRKEEEEELEESQTKIVVKTTTASCQSKPFQRPIRIACVGDSLTRGDASHEQPPPGPKKLKSMEGRGNYPTYLQDLLKLEQGGNNNNNNHSSASSVDVRNFGHGGATACNQSDMPYISTKEFLAAVDFQPDIIVLMLGTNDAKQHHWKSSPCGGQDGGQASLISGIRQILSSLNKQQQQQQIVLLVPPPDTLTDMVWDISQQLLPLVRESLTKEFATLESNTNCRPIIQTPTPDIPSDSPKFFVKDGIHFNTEGSLKLACHVWKNLVDMSSSSATTSTCNNDENNNNLFHNICWDKQIPSKCQELLDYSVVSPLD